MSSYRTSTSSGTARSSTLRVTGHVHTNEGVPVGELNVGANTSVEILYRCSSAHHTPGMSSMIFSRTHVSLSRNQCPIWPILENFVSRTSFRDVFVPFRWLFMLSSHHSIGLPLGLFAFIFNFITTISISPHDMAKRSEFVLVDYRSNW